MKFPYKKYFHQGGVRSRPVIPVEIRNAEQKVTWEVLIDSGSDICLFDIQIGELLGLSFAKPDGQVRGVTGRPVSVYQRQVQLGVSSHLFKVDAHFMNLAQRSRYGIVGQEGFFEHFRVIFDRANEIVELQPKKK